MNATLLSMRMCNMMGSTGLGAEQPLLQILLMSFSSLEMVNMGIDLRGSNSHGNIRIIRWRQTLSNKWILRSWKIRIMVVKLLFMLLTLHCKGMDPDKSSNPMLKGYGSSCLWCWDAGSWVNENGPWEIWLHVQIVCISWTHVCWIPRYQEGLIQVSCKVKQSRQQPWKVAESSDLHV